MGPKDVPGDPSVPDTLALTNVVDPVAKSRTNNCP
jgi:hypothetical protein